jgi:hypothetical protein
LGFSCSFRGLHARIKPNVQQLDVQSLDMMKGALAKGLHRLVGRIRKIRLSGWTGSLAAEETVTTPEPTDARH